MSKKVEIHTTIHIPKTSTGISSTSTEDIALTTHKTKKILVFTYNLKNFMKKTTDNSNSAPRIKDQTILTLNVTN